MNLFKKKSYLTNSFAGKFFEVNSWNLSEFIIDNIIPIVGCHPYPLNELMLMCSAVVYLKPTLIFDWGTHHGKSSRIFFETINSFQINTEIHTIDLNDNSDHPEHPKSEKGKFILKIPEIIQHIGDGSSIANKIYKEKSHLKKVLYFLDGDHEYNSVLNELRSIYNTNPNAHFLIHDTFNQSSESQYNIGPYLAISHFLKDYINSFHILECNLGLPGMTLLINKGNQC